MGFKIVQHTRQPLLSGTLTPCVPRTEGVHNLVHFCSILTSCWSATSNPTNHSDKGATEVQLLCVKVNLQIAIMHSSVEVCGMAIHLEAFAYLLTLYMYMYLLMPNVHACSISTHQVIHWSCSLFMKGIVQEDVALDASVSSSINIPSEESQGNTLWEGGMSYMYQLDHNLSLPCLLYKSLTLPSQAKSEQCTRTEDILPHAPWPLDMRVTRENSTH